MAVASSAFAQPPRCNYTSKKSERCIETATIAIDEIVGPDSLELGEQGTYSIDVTTSDGVLRVVTTYTSSNPACKKSPKTRLVTMEVGSPRFLWNTTENEDGEDAEYSVSYASTGTKTIQVTVVADPPTFCAAKGSFQGLREKEVGVAEDSD